MSPDIGVLQHDIRSALVRRLKPGERVERSMVSALVYELSPLISDDTAVKVVDLVLADMNGLGRLEPLLEDRAVTDVMVVGEMGVWIERNGALLKTDVCLSNDDVMHLIERIVAPLGLRIDRASPMVDARLADGSRVNAVVPPLAVDGPCLTIRRFGARRIDLHEIAEPSVARFLGDAVAQFRNILVSGGTGAGKTTLLNALACHIGSHERVVTIEDAAELRLPLNHVVRLEGRPANSEGAGKVALRDLVRNSLRMRPDRIIVGEVRGAEALDMLQAMNTGHEGSMSTCHANTPIDALRRVETMVLMGDVELPLIAVRQQIASAVDLVVQIARTDSAQRRIVDVSEVIEHDDTYSVRQIGNQYEVFNAMTRAPRRRLATVSAA
jgi:pilus assembly protein CpaF